MPAGGKSLAETLGLAGLPRLLAAGQVEFFGSYGPVVFLEHGGEVLEHNAAGMIVARSVLPAGSALILCPQKMRDQLVAFAAQQTAVAGKPLDPS